MAPRSLWKHGVAYSGNKALLLLAALMAVVIGLTMPGGTAAQGVVIPDKVSLACFDPFSSPNHQRLLKCATLDEEGVRGCCDALKFSRVIADDCVCGVLKVITEDRGINLDNVCETTGIRKPCQDKAEKARNAQEKKAEEERAAKEREDALSKLDACDRFFERMADKDLSKLDPEDARACIQAMKTCPASCSN